MKLGIRVFALLLVMIIVLAGCGEKPATSVDKDVNIQYLPEKVENPDKLPVLKWLCLTDATMGGGPDRVWSVEAAEQLNQMLAERNMPFRLQFILLTRASSKGKAWLELESVQKLLAEADLVNGNLTSAEMKKYLTPITEYATGDAQPSLRNAAPYRQFWDTTTVDGQIYGIRAGRPAQPSAMGWMIDKTVMESWGMSTEDFQGKYFWEMDDVFARIYEANGNVPFLLFYDGGGIESVPNNPAVVAEFYPAMVKPLTSGRYQPIGAFYALDYGQEMPTVVNLLESEYIRCYQEAVIRYHDAGYVTDDAAKNLISYRDIRTDTLCSDEANVYVSVEPVYTVTQRGGYVSGITSTTKCKNEALSLLALIADDEAFRMHLFYGKEGQDFTISSSGIYTMTFHKDPGGDEKKAICYNMDFLSTLSYYSGMTSDRYAEDDTFIYAPNTRHDTDLVPEGMSLLEFHRNLMENACARYPYAASGADTATLTFDFSALLQDVEAVKAALEPYSRDYTNTEDVEDDPETEEDETRHRMTPEYYDQMLAEINAAGGDKIQAELQRQLDEWLKNNPDWNQ